MTRTVSSANQALLNPLGKTHNKSISLLVEPQRGGGVKPLILKKKIYHMIYKIKKLPNLIKYNAN